MRDWAGQLGSCVLFFFLSYRPPRSVPGPGWSLFARLFAFLPSRRPPHSVWGHGLGNRAAKQRHGTVGFSCSFFFVVLPTPSSAPSRGAARVISLLTQWHRTVSFVFFFSFVMHVILFLSAMRFGLGTSPPRGTVGCAIFPFCVRYRPLSSPPRHDGSLREGFDFGFPCLSACVLLQFTFLRLAPLRHADDRREGFDGGWSYHSAFFVSPPSPHWRYAAGFDGWFAFL